MSKVTDFLFTVSLRLKMIIGNPVTSRSTQDPSVPHGTSRMGKLFTSSGIIRANLRKYAVPGEIKHQQFGYCVVVYIHIVRQMPVQRCT